jgi:hypothetical protein
MDIGAPRFMVPMCVQNSEVEAPHEPTIDVRHYFLPSRGTSGERTERGVQSERASSPQPSPPSCVRKEREKTSLSGSGVQGANMFEEFSL